MLPAAYNPFIKSPYQGLLWGVIALCGLACFVLFKMGVMPLMALCGLLGLMAITPLIATRYSWFIGAWLFLVPAFDNLGGGNPVVLAVTGLSVPVSIYLLFRDFNEVRQKAPFVLYLALFVLLLFLNLLNPDKTATALTEFMKFYIELFVVILAYNVIKQGQWRQLANQINGFIVLNSLVALFQRVTGIGMRLIEGVPRVGGLVGHPNVLGFLNVLYFPFALYQYKQAQTPQEKRWWLLGIATSGFAILLTMCKSVLIAFFLDLAVLFWMLPRQVKLKVLFHSVWVILVFVLLDVVLALHLEDSFLSRMENSDSWTWRQKVWGWLMADMNWHNIWLGHGTGWGQAYLQGIDYDEPFLTHNIYIRLLFEFGLVGCVFYLIFLSLLIRFVGPRGEAIRQNICPLLIIAAIFINMGADNSVFLRSPMCFAWILFLLFIQAQNPKGENAMTIK